MTWFRVDDNLCGNKKPRRAGLPAMGLWTIAGSYSSQQGLGGFIPEWYVQTWPSGAKLAAKLVEAGLWSPSEHDGDAGWEFHDWEQCNPSREKVEQDRSAARDRMRAKRSSEQTECSQDVRANTDRTPDVCSQDVLAGAHTRTSAARPGPSRPTTSGTRKRAAQPVPDIFPITELMAAWGRANAPLITDPTAETAKFLDHHRARGSAFKDWAAAWRTWMANAQTYTAERAGRGPTRAALAPGQLGTWDV